MPRAAVAVFATALAAACTNTTSPTPHAPDNASGAEQHAPPADAGAPVAADVAAPQPPIAHPGPDDNGSVVSEYGAPVYVPPPDAGPAHAADAGAPPRQVGRTPRRPNPPPDWGNVQPLYGVSPKI